jgi:DNA-binding transcriptional MerR regulator
MIRSRRRAGARRSKPPRRPAPADSPKSGLKIGEAARLVGVKPFVLRFWETQFAFLKAGHSRYKHRTYGPNDIENLKLVKHLLHERRFTIEGAKKHLSQFGLEQIRAELAGGSTRTVKVAPGAAAGLGAAARQTLSEIRRDLLGLHKLLRD